MTTRSILRRLPGLLAGVPLLGAGCAQFGSSALVQLPSVVRAAGAEEKPAAAAEKVVPLTLDTVFRMAEDQNARVAGARARVDEALAEKNVADANWLPNLYVGTAYYRHEGGIQDPDGRFIHSSFGAAFGGLEVAGKWDVRELAYERVNACRKVWQQRGELSRLTSETLLDGAETYIDLLAARTGEALALETEKTLQDLLVRTKKLAEVETAPQVEVARIEAELAARKQLILKLREQQAAASAKLVYLLGLDPCTVLVPGDNQMVPIELVDVTPPACDLVSRALTHGPGVREMEGLLSLLHQSLERARGRSYLIPIVEMHAAEGIFGAGQGASSTWDNRFDFGIQARWNLTELATRCDKQRALDSRVSQAEWAYQDLRGKLTAGVQESREAIVSGRGQIQVGQQQIDSAAKAYDLSDQRLRKGTPGSTPSEVLLSIQASSLAKLNYLAAVRAYDKAQLRLLILLGPGESCATPAAARQAGH